MHNSNIGQTISNLMAGRWVASLLTSLCLLSPLQVAIGDDEFLKEPDAAAKQEVDTAKQPEILKEAKAADRLGGPSIFGEKERLPEVADGEMTLPPLIAATTNVENIGNGSTPKKFRTEDETPTSDLPEVGYERDSNWSPMSYQFAAANTFSYPRYFEDRMLERHGYERFPCLQPMISGARFFGTFPALPYLMTINPPGQIQSQLGYFRPGSPVYPYVQRPPYQRDAAINEAAAVAGAIIAIP